MSDIGEVSRGPYVRYGAVTATGVGALATSLVLGVLFSRLSNTRRVLLAGSTVFLGGATILQLCQPQAPTVKRYKSSPEVWPAEFEQLQAVVGKMGDRVRVDHAHDHHALHDRLTALAGRVDKVAYTQLLDSLEGKTIVYPNNYSAPFSTALERRRLLGEKPEISLEHLDAIPEDLVALDKECFSEPYSRAYMEGRLRSGAKFLAARDENNRLVGIAIYSTRQGETCIESIGRSAPYARLGIGRRLMQGALEESRRLGAHLVRHSVRESNRPARQLYQSFGFVQSGPAHKSYYRVPDEAAIPMATDIGYACLIGRLDALLGSLRRNEEVEFEDFSEGIKGVTAGEPFHHHLLCDRLAQITRLMPDEWRDEWEAVLEELDGLVITYPTGQKESLSLDLLRGESPELAYERLGKITDDDLEDMERIGQLCFTAVVYRGEGLRRALEEGGDRSLVARHEGRIVGWFSYRVKGDVLEVTRLGRLPQYSGLGMLEHFKAMLAQEASAFGVEKVRCQVRAGNSAAIALYKRAGLEILGRIPSGYRLPKEDALIMGAQIKM